MTFIKSNLGLGAGLAAMMIAGIGLVVRPAYVSARALDRDIESKREELGRPGSGPEAIERLARDLAALKELGSERMTPIPAESGVATLVRQLSESFDELGLKDREVSTGASKQLDEASCLPMTIAITGGFPAIFDALRRVESLERLVRVQRFRVALEGKNRDGFDRSGRVRADLQLDVFFAPKQLASPTAAAKQGTGTGKGTTP